MRASEPFTPRSAGEYGWAQVRKELLAHGMRVGKDCVQWFMKTHGIRARSKRRFVVTTGSRHDLPAVIDQPDEARRKLARGPIKESRVTDWLWPTLNKGKAMLGHPLEVQQRRKKCIFPLKRNPLLSRTHVLVQC